MNWEEAASRLESSFNLPRISRSIAEKFDSSEVIYVACSGGADSIFALLLLRAYLAERGRSDALRALHFDHALRGEASEADARFVKELCGGLGIPFLDAKAEWPADADHVNEAAAREARFSFFRKATGASDTRPVCIATGHHADDVVETMLMRLSRGAGLQGLCAPRESSEAGGGLVFLRPLLEWSREEIRTALQAASIPWREDETNASEANYRSRLRKETISSWEDAADRKVRPGVLRSRRLLAEDAQALDEVAEYFWSKCWDAKRRVLKRARVEELPIALRRRLLLRLSDRGTIAADAMELALAAIESGECLKLEVSRGVYLDVSGASLSMRSEGEEGGPVNWSAFALPIGAIAYLPDGARLQVERVLVDEALRKKIVSGGNDDRRIVYLRAAGNQRARLWVRLRASGDAFKPLGKSSAKKLKKLFIDRKIDRKDRDRLPVFVCEESGILWVPGVPPNAERRLGFGAEAALRLTYDR